MAIGGVRKEVCKFRAINIAKKYGLTLNTSSNGKNIGTNMIKISVHSNGHPKRKIIICVMIKNCQVVISIDLKKKKGRLITDPEGGNSTVAKYIIGQ